MAEQKFKQTIEDWMLTIVRDGGVDRYDDLHIDAIDPAWKQKPSWMAGSLLAFHAALKLRDSQKLPYTVGLGISLRGTVPQPFENVWIADLQANLDHTPPSLYMFNPAREPQMDLERALQEGTVYPNSFVTPLILKDNPSARSCFFMRFRRMNFEEHTQSVFLLG